MSTGTPPQRPFSGSRLRETLFFRTHVSSHTLKTALQTSKAQSSAVPKEPLGRNSDQDDDDGIVVRPVHSASINFYPSQSAGLLARETPGEIMMDHPFAEADSAATPQSSHTLAETPSDTPNEPLAEANLSTCGVVDYISNHDEDTEDHDLTPRRSLRRKYYEISNDSPSAPKSPSVKSRSPPWKASRISMRGRRSRFTKSRYPVSRRPNFGQGRPRASSSTTRTNRAYAVDVPHARLIPAGCSWPTITGNINLVTVANLAKKVYEKIFPQLDEEERRSFIGFAEKAMNPSISSLSALTSHPFTKYYDTDKSFIRIIWLYMLFGHDKAKQSNKLFGLVRRDYPGWDPAKTWLPPHKLPATVHTSFGPPTKDVLVTEEVTGCGVDPTDSTPIPLPQAAPVSNASRPTNAVPKAHAGAAQRKDSSSEPASSKKSNEPVKSPEKPASFPIEAMIETIIKTLNRHETLISQQSDKHDRFREDFEQVIIHLLKQITESHSRCAPSQDTQAPWCAEFSALKARVDDMEAMTLRDRQKIVEISSTLENMGSAIDELQLPRSEANYHSMQNHTSASEQSNKQHATHSCNENSNGNDNDNGNKDFMAIEPALKHYMNGRFDAAENSIQNLHELYGQMKYQLRALSSGK